MSKIISKNCFSQERERSNSALDYKYKKTSLNNSLKVITTLKYKYIPTNENNDFFSVKKLHKSINFNKNTINVQKSTNELIQQYNKIKKTKNDDFYNQLLNQVNERIEKTDQILKKSNLSIHKNKEKNSSNKENFEFTLNTKETEESSSNTKLNTQISKNTLNSFVNDIKITNEVLYLKKKEILNEINCLEKQICRLKDENIEEEKLSYNVIMKKKKTNKKIIVTKKKNFFNQNKTELKQSNITLQKKYEENLNSEINETLSIFKKVTSILTERN